MAQTTVPMVRTALPRATLGETLGVFADVLIPTVAKGVIIRRPQVLALAERLELDRRAIRRMQQLRNRYGDGPLLLRIPLRSQAIILAPAHVKRVLDESPEPFATASSEKRAALAHFQPQGVLISHGPARAERRRFNEQVLESNNPLHHLAERFVAVVEAEAALLRAAIRHRELLTWDDFALTWFRVVRRVLFGDGARDDYMLTELMAQLRADANWAFFKPKRRGLRAQFYQRLNAQLARAEPGSLAAVMAATPTTPITAPGQQVPQWLFAFDPAGMATFRTLALLASHPLQAGQAREEIHGRDGAGQPQLPYLRACVLESLRLWPTTPMVLRQTTRETTWETGPMPARTGILIFAPFFHRDDQRLAFSDRFTPELWLEPGTTQQWPLIPFSSGPAICPGRHLVLLLGSAMLAALLGEQQFRLLSPPWLSADKPLPATLNHYGLRFAVVQNHQPLSASV